AAGAPREGDACRRGLRRASALDRLGRARGCPEELPGLPDELAVGVDLAVAPEVADELPVQPGFVHAAELPERSAPRDVPRPADLLVEERVVREAVDLVVEAERDLAEPARSVSHQPRPVGELA